MSATMRILAALTLPLLAQVGSVEKQAQAVKSKDGKEVCAQMLLPERMQLTPQPSGWFGYSRAGHWQSLSGATFASWAQGLAFWSSKSTSVNAGPQRLYNTQDVGGLAALPGARFHRMRSSAATSFTSTALKDCQGRLAYVIRVDDRRVDAYEIFNADGELLATTKRDAYVEDRLRFLDKDGQSIALAQSPAIAPPTAPSSGPGTLVNSVAAWQIQFDKAHDGSPLMLPQNRWVVAAVVQDRALSDALRRDNGLTRHLLFLAVALLLIGGVASMPSGSFLDVHDVLLTKKAELLARKAELLARLCLPRKEAQDAGAYGATANIFRPASRPAAGGR